MIGTIITAVTSRMSPKFISKFASLNKAGSGGLNGDKTILIKSVMMLGGSLVILL